MENNPLEIVWLKHCVKDFKNLKEEELRIRWDEVESLKKVYEELVHIKKGLPEIIRSEVAKEIKMQHREIEKYTNPNTKSQKNETQTTS